MTIFLLFNNFFDWFDMTVFKVSSNQYHGVILETSFLGKLEGWWSQDWGQVCLGHGYTHLPSQHLLHVFIYIYIICHGWDPFSIIQSFSLCEWIWIISLSIYIWREGSGTSLMRHGGFSCRGLDFASDFIGRVLIMFGGRDCDSSDPMHRPRLNAAGSPTRLCCFQGTAPFYWCVFCFWISVSYGTSMK